MKNLNFLTEAVIESINNAKLQATLSDNLDNKYIVEKINSYVDIGEHCFPINQFHKKELSGIDNKQGDYNLKIKAQFINYLNSVNYLPFKDTMFKVYLKVYECRDFFTDLNPETMHEAKLTNAKRLYAYCTYCEGLQKSKKFNENNQINLTGFVKHRKDESTKVSDAKEARTEKISIPNADDSKDNLKIEYNKEKNSKDDVIDRIVRYYKIETFVEYLKDNGYNVTKIEKKESKTRRRQRATAKKEDEIKEAIAA